MQNWLYAVGGFIIGIAIVKFIKYVVVRRLKHYSKRSTNTFDDFLIALVERSVVPLLYILVFFSAYNYLDFNERTDKVIGIALLVAATFFGLRIITSTVKYIVFIYLDRKDESEIRKKQVGGLLVIVNIFVWIVGFLFLLDNFGFDITTLLTGLGIGGIAIALAAQNILGDLFSYFTIFFDRPFEIGDYVQVGTESGTIEYIGIKTTRIRTLTGDQLVCSNKDLTESRLHNYRSMAERRIVFTLELNLETAVKDFQNIPSVIQGIVEKQEQVRFDRSHLISFDNARLNFEVVYYMLDPDFTLYRNTHQAILFSIFDWLKSKDISIAYPVNTVYLQDECSDGSGKKHENSK